MATYTWLLLDFLNLPPVKDVGAPVATIDPFDGRGYGDIWFVGIDGSLWNTDWTFGKDAEQVPSPGELQRVAVSPDRSIWCVDSHGQLWTMSANRWKRVPVAGETVRNVDVSADRTVWLTIDNGRYYTIRPGQQPVYQSVLIPVTAVSGLSEATKEYVFGRAWGISDVWRQGGLISSLEGLWNEKSIAGVAELSVSADGVVWLVKTDGTVWTTEDGQLQTRMGNVVARRVAAGIAGTGWCVTPEGRAYTWRQQPSGVTTPPDSDPHKEPTPVVTPPVIHVTVSGAGDDTVFKLSGSGFIPGSQVTIRGARVGDGTISQSYWVTTAHPKDGTFEYDISLPCKAGLVFHFSANDGRDNPADFTDKLWSNTVKASCPATDKPKENNQVGSTKTGESGST